MKKEQLTFIARAIKAIDQIVWFQEWGTEDYKRINNARKELIDIVFDAGYELQSGTYRVIVSKTKRDLQ